MPEGDTIHKIANYLAPRLRSHKIISISMADQVAAAQCRSRCIEDVTARGKHLFIELDNHMALRSHLGMYGSWHRYALGEPWKKPRRQASLVISVAGDEYVCFNAKEIELINLSSVRDRIVHSRLGPDLITDGLDFGELGRRACELLEENALLADVLLDQRVASGIGNVYKSEVLFIEQLMPNTRLSEIATVDLERCFSTAADRLRRNLGSGQRVTRLEKDGAGPLWVYGRMGLFCLRCEGRIVSRRLGRYHRSTYWCPDCQAQ